ncbi:homeodomain-interacting protein kinase 2-like isoform X2 [Poecilia reticulata]|uniref:homeodomain-interacting protein kinase 2-like isoform X2 n=1 Tax=Poecilia reticulata TaxID=8081 RepID=UPI0004A39700|nr:PREDICTED: homeodomain-interacting protein kinase 2-like isoform X2 [Poecilia reticulata]
MGIGISSPSWDYEMEHYLGSGAYGAVVQSKKLGTNETVALKVIKNERYMEIAKKEVEILQYLKGLGSDKFNIVMLNDSFTHVGCYYMEFEKLDINLTDFLRKKPQRSLEQKDICPIVHQMKHIVLTFGNPPEYLLNSGLNTMQFFNKNDGEEEPCGQWTLRRNTEIGNINFIPQRTLDFLNMLRENVSDENAGESERDSFVKLVADMLKVDSAKRISPSEILLHPFVAKSRLVDNSIHGKSSSSAGSKTKIDQNDNAESGNRSPDGIPAKRRKECEDVEMICAQTSPSMSP